MASTAQRSTGTRVGPASRDRSNKRDSTSRSSRSGSGSAGSGTSRSGIWREIQALALLLGAGILFLSVFSHGRTLARGDLAAENVCGVFGRWVGEVSILYLGLLPSMLVLVTATAWAVVYFFRVPVVGWSWKVAGAVLLGLGFGILEWLVRAEPIYSAQDAFYPAGGVFGSFLGQRLVEAFNSLGTYLIAGFCALVGVILATEMLISPLLARMLLRGGAAAAEAGRRVPGALALVGQLLPSFGAATAERAAENERASKSERGSKGRDPEGRGSEGRGSEGRDSEGRDQDGRGSEGRGSEETDERLRRRRTGEAAEPASAETVTKAERPPRKRSAKGPGGATADVDVDADEDDDDTDDRAPSAIAAGSLTGVRRGAVPEGPGARAARVSESTDESSQDDENGAEAEALGAALPRPPRTIRLGLTDHDPGAPDPTEGEPGAAHSGAPGPQASGPAAGRPAAGSGAFEIDETQLQLQGCYSLPSLSLLIDPPAVAHEDGREELEQVAEKIEQTLASFKIEAAVGEIQRGPVITQYEVSLGPGIKVHKIVSLADDLAMALSARSIRVVAPIPGKSAVGIEVPNRQRETVVLKELLLSRQFRECQQRIPLLLGKDAAGVPIIEDLTRMPHLLLAGATGSGKSVCINTIITSMLMTRTPDELKLILVDPKMVELSIYEDIPHLLTPVITDMKKAPAALEWLVRKMDERYDLLSKAEVRHINDYNELDPKERYDRLAARIGHEDAENAPKHLPYIVIVIDELADLMMTNGKDVETSVVRLSQKSRAVGIHVVLATQRPSVDVITGLIKSNLPCRISFKVASRVDSRTILDSIGSERLLGQGDMLYIPPGASALERAQCTFITDKEIKRVVRFLKKEASPQFSREIEGYLEVGATGGDASEPIDDDLFDQAVRIILESQRGSASLLQRRLGIGYTRASRLMDIMGERGIVGSFKGSKAREVVMTLEEWEARQAEGMDSDPWTRA